MADLINDTYACENDYTLNELLKKQAGFQGYVMTDWGGHHSTMSAVAGMDVRLSSDSIPCAIVSLYASDVYAG